MIFIDVNFNGNIFFVSTVRSLLNNFTSQWVYLSDIVVNCAFQLLSLWGKSDAHRPPVVLQGSGVVSETLGSLNYLTVENEL